MIGVEIKRMALCHINDIAAVEQLCFSTPWSEKSISDELSNPHARFFVAEVDGKVAGYIGAHNIVGDVYITNVAVMPVFRRQGVGECLVEYLVNVCRDEGAEFITLEVRKSNVGAISLYEKAGFSVVGERKAFYELPREDALLMTIYLKEQII